MKAARFPCSSNASKFKLRLNHEWTPIDTNQIRARTSRKVFVKIRVYWWLNPLCISFFRWRFNLPLQPSLPGHGFQRRPEPLLELVTFLWTCGPARSNLKIMKTKYLLGFVLFITTTVLLSGCGKADTKLESENTALKARLQKLESQLQASSSQAAPQGSQPASTPDLTSQLDEAQKKAEAAADELKSLSSQVEAQKAKIDSLTGELAKAQQAREKAEKALQLYQDKAASAIKEFQALRSTLSGQPVKLDGYHQRYLGTQTAVTKLVAPLPESKVRREILDVLATFARINETWETADRQMEERATAAQADYDKFVNFGGVGPNDYVIKMGKEKILAPVEQANAATASGRDQQILSLGKDLDLGIKNLQDLVNGQKT